MTGMAGLLDYWNQPLDNQNGLLDNRTHPNYLKCFVQFRTEAKLSLGQKLSSG